MKDLLSLSVLALIVFSKFLGLFLILAGFGAALIVVGFATMIDPSLPEAVQRAEYWNGVTSRDGLKMLGLGLVLALVGVWLIKIPTMKMWPGPDVKTRVEEIG
jgi:hypothetical protein